MARLICLVMSTEPDADTAYASLEMTPELAVNLLALKDAWKDTDRVTRHRVGELYRLEIWDTSVDYHDDAYNLDEESLLSDQWYHSPCEPGYDDAWNVAAPTLNVTRDGVFWSALPKHGDHYYETPEIPWDDLRAVARGQMPFPAAPQATLTDTPDTEE